MTVAARGMRELIKFAEEHGWKVERTSKNHLRFQAPDGESTVHASGTPSDNRAIANLRADLRRAGLPL